MRWREFALIARRKVHGASARFAPLCSLASLTLPPPFPPLSSKNGAKPSAASNNNPWKTDASTLLNNESSDDEAAEAAAAAATTSAAAAATSAATTTEVKKKNNTGPYAGLIVLGSSLPEVTDADEVIKQTSFIIAVSCASLHCCLA